MNQHSWELVCQRKIEMIHNSSIAEWISPFQGLAPAGLPMQSLVVAGVIAMLASSDVLSRDLWQRGSNERFLPGTRRDGNSQILRTMRAFRDKER